MEFIELTGEDNNPIAVNVDNILYFQPCKFSPFSELSWAKTHISMGRDSVYVQETYEQVKEILEKF
jgi:hypothetical protein